MFALAASQRCLGSNGVKQVGEERRLSSSPSDITVTGSRGSQAGWALPCGGPEPGDLGSGPLFPAL